MNKANTQTGMNTDHPVLKLETEDIESQSNQTSWVPHLDNRTALLIGDCTRQMFSNISRK